MDNKEIAQAILESYNIENVEIITCNSYRQERLEILPNRSGRVYLRKEGTSLEAQLLGSHEVCHFLNNKEGKSDYFLLKKWEKYFGMSLVIYGTLLLAYLILAVLNLLNIEIASSLILLTLFPLMIVFKYFRLYSKDEILTEERSLEEIKLLQAAHLKKFDIEEMERLVKFRKKYYVFGITLFSESLAVFFLILAIVDFVKDYLLV